MLKCMTIWLLLTVTTAPAYAQEEDEWSVMDSMLLATSSALIAMDWAQTLHIARNPEKYGEANPLVAYFVGFHPSEGRVNVFCGASIIGNALIAKSLKHPSRTRWLTFWIMVEGGIVQHNRSGPTGIGISAHF